MRVGPAEWLLRLFRAGVVGAVIYFALLPFIARVRAEAHGLQSLDLSVVTAALAFQLSALIAYSVMTRVALGEERDQLGLGRLFAIQLSTKAVTNAVPGGAALGPALGFRLLTAAGATGPRAGAALTSGATASAFVLNALLWLALVVSVPMFGFRPLYAVAALIGIIVMMALAAALIAIVEGSTFVERLAHMLARVLRRDGDELVAGLRRFARSLEELIADGRVCRRIVALAAANWLLDAAALWLLLAALGNPINPVGVLVAFGIANVLAALPLTPGGIGVVESAYLPMLVAFGATLEQAALAVAVYRVCQWAFPVVLGAVAGAGLWLDGRDVTRPLAS